MRELELLERILPGLHSAPETVVANGDDCAAVRCGGAVLLLAADQLVGGVHFVLEATAPERAGEKLLKRNLSDIAAMGGTPAWALCCTASAALEEEYLVRFYDGIEQAARRYGTALVGGDLSHLPPRADGLVASLAIAGTVPEGEVVRRAGAHPGDLLYVTGLLGNSFASGHHLDFEPRLREGRFLAEGHFSAAMLDLSDGLLIDAGRLARASGVRAALELGRLPLRAGADVSGALSDGEDYELLFAVPAGREAELLRRWPENFAPLSRIGECRAGSGVVDWNGITPNGKKGYEHQL